MNALKIWIAKGSMMLSAMLMALPVTVRAETSRAVPFASAITDSKSSKTVGEYLEKRKAWLTDKQYRYLKAHGKDALSEKMPELAVIAAGHIRILIPQKTIDLKMQSADDQSFTINGRLVDFSETRAMEAIWKDVEDAVNPATSSKLERLWRLMNPEAHAILPLIALGVAITSLVTSTTVALSIANSNNCDKIATVVGQCLKEYRKLRENLGWKRMTDTEIMADAKSMKESPYSGAVQVSSSMQDPKKCEELNKRVGDLEDLDVQVRAMKKKVLTFGCGDDVDRLSNCHKVIIRDAKKACNISFADQPKADPVPVWEKTNGQQ